MTRGSVRHWFRKRENWVIDVSVACTLWLWSLANQPVQNFLLLRVLLETFVGEIVYLLYVLVQRWMTREFWVVLGQGPIHHLCQCWASRIITATSTCSWALSIASVEDCRWLSDRTSSAPASTVDQSAFWERREKAASSTTPMEEACSVVPGSEHLSLSRLAKPSSSWC